MGTSPGRPRGTTKKRRVRPKAPRGGLWRSLAAMAVLLVLIAAGGYLLHRFLRIPAPQPAPPRSAVRSAVKPPVYEVFPTEEPPAAKPERLPPAPEAPPRAKPLVSIIVDDLGYDMELAEAFMALDRFLTYSILPHSPFQRVIARKLHAAGKEIMLHLPMEPIEYPEVDPGPGALLVSMSTDVLLEKLRANLEAVPYIKGVNNHMGSRMTMVSTCVYPIFTVLKKRGLFFVDSRTTALSLCRPSARLLQIPFAQRDVFIDHLHEPAFIEKQLHKLVRISREKGKAIGIAHPNPVTLQVMKRSLEMLREEVRLVPVSEMVRIPPADGSG